jgi:chromosome segregation ATPase
LREKERENQVLSDALDATRKAATQSEMETAKLKDGLADVVLDGDDDEKTQLIVSLVDKLDRLATRYSSVMSTPTVSIPRSPEASTKGADAELLRENHELAAELERVLRENAQKGGNLEELSRVRKQLKAAQDMKIAALADAEAFQMERDAARGEVERLRRALDEKASSRGQPTTGAESSERMRELESLLAEAQNAIALLSDDNEALLHRVKRYGQDGSSADRAEVKAAQQAARDAAEAARAVAQEAENAIMEARRGNGGELAQELETQRALAARRAEEIEQLKSIIGDIDSQRDALSQKLRVAYANLREVESKRDTSSRFEGSSAEKILALEDECMRLQDEADTAVSALEEARERAMREGAAAEEARRLGATAEAKVYGALQERDAAIAHARTLQEQAELAEDKQRAVASEIAQYREELAVVSDDLMAMTKEQQILNSELQRATMERDDAMAQLREAQSAQGAAEANARTKQKELDDVVRTYEELNAENRRVVSDMHDMERDMRRAKAALEAHDDSLAQALERAKTAEAESKAYATDLDAYQRQVDNLTRLLNDTAREKGEDVGSYEAMNKKLESSRAMLFEMERAKEMARRETAAAEANLTVVRSRLTDAQGDIETLKHKLRLETNRVKELESLASALRTQGHQAAVQSGDDSQRSELLRERVNALQDQNQSLSGQVDALKRDRKSFETEVERLRNVIESTAGVSTPRTGESNTSALMRAESQAKESAEEAQRLAASLKETQDKCERLDVKLREAHAAAMEAKRELVAVSRKEAEARAEIGGLRSELAISKDALREAMEAGGTSAEVHSLQMRVMDAERRAASAEASLASVDRAGPVSEASAEELRVLRAENERLLNLLAKANDDLSAARKIIDEKGYTDGATTLLATERVQAAEEKAQRIEREFERLVEQMKELESGSGGGELLERFKQLEEVNAELEYENDSLRQSLAGTEEAIAIMQRDLARTVEEYATLGTTLVETFESEDGDEY